MPVHVEVARGGGDGDEHVVHVLRDNNLAAQPTAGSEPEGLVQHVLLILAGQGQAAVDLLGEDAVARAARAHALGMAHAVRELRVGVALRGRERMPSA